MSWSKDTTPEWAADYRKSFLKDPVGTYTDRSEKRPVLRSMRLSEGSVVLDAGCGTGRFLKEFPSAVRSVGLDLSREMLLIAREENQDGGVYVVGMVDQMPFPDASIDEVVSVRVLQHMRDQSRAIREMARVLKPEGRLIVLALNSWTLHCIYKNMRLGRTQKVVNFPIGWWLGKRSPLRPWAHPYDNYSSLVELRQQFRDAGLEVVGEKGGTIGAPWIFNYFRLHGILGRHGLSFLGWFFTRCEQWETRLESTALKYFMDKVIIEGVKR